MSRTVRRQRGIQRFGEKLHRLRSQRGLSLIELANLLGYRAHGYLSELETGKKLPTVEMVVSIAKLFDISTDQLLMDELELENHPKEE